MKCCRQSSGVSAAAVPGAAACSARVPAGTVRSRTRCAMPISGPPRPVIPAIWGSRSAICRTCRTCCAPLPGSREIRSSAGGGRWKKRENAEGFHKVVNALAMAASYDPDPTQFLGIRLPVTFDTCEIIEERWANWLRQDPVVAMRNSSGQSAPAEGALYRLRRVGPVQSALRRPQAGAPAERARNCASLRGVPRQPQRRRLPDGREPAFSRRRRCPADRRAARYHHYGVNRSAPRSARPAACGRARWP